MPLPLMKKQGAPVFNLLSAFPYIINNSFPTPCHQCIVMEAGKSAPAADVSTVRACVNNAADPLFPADYTPAVQRKHKDHSFELLVPISNTYNECGVQSNIFIRHQTKCMWGVSARRIYGGFCHYHTDVVHQDAPSVYLLKNEYDSRLNYVECTGLGLYVHLPFCSQLCSFCPYCMGSCILAENAASKVDALIKEIHLSAGRQKEKKPVTSLYFGGGTPALAAPV